MPNKATENANEEKRQITKEEAVRLALSHGMALIRRNLQVWGMKEDGSTIFLSKSKTYDTLWEDALKRVKKLSKKN